MGQDFQLKATRRDIRGKKNKQIRESGQVPGVIYGQGGDADAISIEQLELERVYRHAGSNQLVDVSLDGETKTVLFHDVQINPVKGHIDHFDFYTVKMDEAIRTEVPIHFEGEAAGEYKEGGVLIKPLETVEVEALPRNLPESFTIDISGMDNIGDMIHVSDLKIPAEVTLITPGEEQLVRIDEPRSEEELEELDEEIAEDAEDAVASEHGEEDEGGEGEAAESEDDGDSKQE